MSLYLLFVLPLSLDYFLKHMNGISESCLCDALVALIDAGGFETREEDGVVNKIVKELVEERSVDNFSPNQIFNILHSVTVNQGVGGIRR